MSAEEAITLDRLSVKRVQIPVIGVTPLIVHRFDEKSKEMMLNAQQGKAKAKKAPKDPEAEYQRSRYLLPDGTDGFPAPGFKSAIVGAARQFDGLPMTKLRQSLFIRGEGPDQLVRINGEPKRREDTVRVGGSKADLRYRAMYPEWSVVLDVEFIQTALTLDAVVALVDAAGLGGVGEWRPSKAETGTFGRFQVANDKEIEEVSP